MKLCEVCGSPEHPSWKAHIFVRREDEKEQFRKLQVGLERPKGDDRGGVKARLPAERPKRLGEVVRSKNRRGLEAYNAYQKDYMKVWRAVKSGRACSWPR